MNDLHKEVVQAVHGEPTDENIWAYASEDNYYLKRATSPQVNMVIKIIKDREEQLLNKLSFHLGVSVEDLRKFAESRIES